MKFQYLNIRYKSVSLSFGFILVCCIQLFNSCNDNELLTNKKEIPPIKINRFDVDLYQFDTLNFEISEKNILLKHPINFPFYIEQLMGLGTVTKGLQYYRPYFSIFKSGEYEALYDSCTLLYKDISSIEKELRTAFSHYHHYFPTRKIPKITSFIISPNGNFPAAFTYGDHDLGINLFCYLGENFTFYNGIYDNYWRKWLDVNYMVRNSLLTIYNEYDNASRPSGELIYEMIESGKKMYYLDCILPEISDEIKIGYTKEQLAWCQDNEKEIWKFFIENKLLYSLDNIELKRYTLEGPTTPGMPAQSPGMVGTWIGWQIVKKYMKGNANPDLEKLLYKTSAKEILNTTKYKP